MLLSSVAFTGGTVLGRTAKNVAFRQTLARCRSTATVVADSAMSNNSLPEEWIHAKPYSEVPGPKSIPLLGNFPRIVPKIFAGSDSDLGSVPPKDLLKVLYQRYGPIVKIKIPGKPDFVFVGDAEACEHILRNEGPWPVREGTDSLDYYFTKVRKNLKVSLTSSQGKEWQEFRTAVNQIMMQPRRARAYTKPVNTVAQEFLDRVWSIRDSKGELPEDFLNELAKYTLESIIYITLDTRLGTFADNLAADSEPQRMIKSVHDAFECTFLLDFSPSPWKYVSTPAYRRFIKSMDYFQGVALKHVTNAIERLKSLPPADQGNREYSVLERLLVETDDPSKAVAMAMDMALAGVDTTSMLIAVAMYHIAANPEKQRILQEELDRLIPEPSKPITAEQLEQLKYLKASIRESSRMEPVVPGNARTLVKDMVIIGYQIPKGTRMTLLHSVMGMEEKYFPRANEFLPERWLPGGESLKARHPFAHLPFGFGPRMCVGQRFANLEAEIFIAKLFRSFTLEWHYPPPEAEIKLLFSYTSPLKFTIKKRS